MSETFTKLFGSITESTIWSEDNETRLVWITMLAMADQNGYVGASLPGLAHRARVPLEATEKAVAKFLAPDPYSRNPSNQGRRIEVEARGWVILNYRDFRDLRDDEIRREYERNRKREQRKRASGTDGDSPTMSINVPQCLPMSAQAEADKEADQDQELLSGLIVKGSVHHDLDENRPVQPRKERAETAQFLAASFHAFWNQYPRKVGKGAAQKVWKRVAVDEPTVKKIAEALKWQRTQPQWNREKGRFIPHAATWLNQKRYDDEPFEVATTSNGWDSLKARVHGNRG